MSDNQIIKKQVQTLPIGPPGSDSTKRKLTDMNSQLTLIHAQAVSDTKFDSKPLPTITKQKTIENYSDINDHVNKTYTILSAISVLLIVYGIVSK
jgi:hypothetical protein